MIWATITAVILLIIWLVFSDGWSAQSRQRLERECHKFLQNKKRFYSRYITLQKSLPPAIRPVLFSAIDSTLLQYSAQAQKGWRILQDFDIASFCQAPTESNWRTIWRFLRWRWRLKRYTALLNTLADLNLALEKQLKNLNALQRKTIAASQKKLAAALKNIVDKDISADNRKDAQQYTLILEHIHAARDDIESRQPFRVARASVYADLITIGVEGFFITDANDIIQTVALDQTVQAIITYTQTLERLLKEPPPLNWEALQKVDTRVKQTHKTYRTILDRINEIHTQTTRCREYCRQILSDDFERLLKARESVISQIQNQGNSIFGPDDGYNLWWQQATENGNPAAIFSKIQSMRQSLTPACYQEQWQEGQLSDLLTQFDQLFEHIKRLSLAITFFQSVLTRSSEIQNKTRYQIEKELKHDLGALQNFLYSVKALEQHRKRYTNLERRWQDLKKRLEGYLSPQGYESLQRDLQTLKTDTETLRNQIYAELKALKENVTQKTVTFLAQVDACQEKLLIHPAIAPLEIPDFIRAKELQNQISQESIQQDDDFISLQQRLENLQQGLRNIQRAAQQIDQIRKRWKEAQERAQKTEGRLQKLIAHIQKKQGASQSQTSRMNYDAWEEDAQNYFQKINTLRLRPADALYCTQATQELNLLCQKGEFFYTQTNIEIKKLELLDTKTDASHD